jgi:hypothetical protein
MPNIEKLTFGPAAASVGLGSLPPFAAIANAHLTDAPFGRLRE